MVKSKTGTKTNRKFSRVRGKITTGPKGSPTCRLTIPVGSFENMASDVYNDPRFQKLFSDTKSVDDEEITILIEHILLSRRVSVEDLDRVTLHVRMYLRNLVEAPVKELGVYNWDTDTILTRVYENTHDVFGNVY